MFFVRCSASRARLTICASLRLRSVISWKQLTALIALFAASVAIVIGGAPALGVHVLKPYQQQRLTGFLHPSHDPGNQTYNITESLIAIGSGGKTGRGSNATQTKLDFLPAQFPREPVQRHHRDAVRRAGATAGGGQQHGEKRRTQAHGG